MRNKIMNDIKAGRDCPTGLNRDIWDRLKRICESESFQRKSAAMRYANSCRHSLGRIGPGGEISVRQTLKERFDRSPDPEEVQTEMAQDKGYRGKKKAMLMAHAGKAAAVPYKSHEDGTRCDLKLSNDFHKEVRGNASEKKKVESHV